MTLKQLMQRFATEEACRLWLERVRWPEGPVCPRCGVLGRGSRLSTRPRQVTCLDCRHRYSVTSGTAMHSTKLPLRTWILAMYLVVSSSKGISSLKLAAWLGIDYKSAWHLGHRIRSMMRGEAALLRGVVELDETYVGGKPRRKHRERALPKRCRRSKRFALSVRAACAIARFA